MPPRHLIVIAVDGLRASALGAYGNAWHPTPHLDNLASESIVLDAMWCDGPTTADYYRGAWGGRDAGGATRPQDAEVALAPLIATKGISSSLTTDDRQLAANGFQDVVQVESTAVGELASTIADTSLARLFAVAAQQLPAPSDPPKLFWVHARGFHGPWDAPLELRAGLLEEGDPPPPTTVAPPRRRATDHDELLLDRVAYAAQAIVLDECVGALMAAIAESGLDREAVVALVGCRGYALGEHGDVGGDALYSELLHVPCLIRLPGVEGPPQRASELAAPADLYATLLRLFAVEPSDKGQGVDLLADDVRRGRRQFVAALGSDGQRAIRTAAWMLRLPPQRIDGQPNAAAELFSKPDDRWEFNDVASRCPAVAQGLTAVLDRWQAGGQGALDAQLDPELTNPAR